MSQNAITGAGYIHKSEIESVALAFLKEFFPTGLLKSDYLFLGSTGFREWSGDIDIGIDDSKYSYDQLCNMADQFTHIHNIQCMKMPGFKIISFGIPFQMVATEQCPRGERTGLVQIDLISGKLKWMDFAIRNPDGNGAKRNMLLMAIAASKGKIKRDNDEIVARITPSFSRTDGLICNMKFRKTKKDGTYTKTEYPATNADAFFDAYPELKTANIRPMSDPTLVCAFLMDQPPINLDTFDKVYSLVLMNEDRDCILDIYNKLLEKF